MCSLKKLQILFIGQHTYILVMAHLLKILLNIKAVRLVKGIVVVATAAGLEYDSTFCMIYASKFSQICELNQEIWLPVI